MKLAIIGAAVLAGIVQGVTGFGSGIVLMMVLPMFFPCPKVQDYQQRFVCF